MNINEYGAVPNYDNLPGIPARITAVHKDRYEIVSQHGITHARLKTKEYYVDTRDFPTTGDYVMVNYIENGDSQILAPLPRRTYFSRREPGPVPREQAVAANFDYVFIMQSLNMDFNLKRLKSGVMIIDTPGMRELGVWDVSEGLGDAFADVEAFIGRCRFSDCKHEKEPGCAIKAAIAAGELDLTRWESYQNLKAEAVDKAEMLRRKNEWHKSLAKFTRQRNKEIW